jgi:hypothetical protein
VSALAGSGKSSLVGLFYLSGGLFFIFIVWASFQPSFQMVGEILANPQADK